MCLNFKTDSKEPSTAGDYCKVQTALTQVPTQCPEARRGEARRHSNPRQASRCLALPGPHTPMFRHHSHNKVRFKNKFTLRNALVFILRFKMVL